MSKGRTPKTTNAEFIAALRAKVGKKNVRSSPQQLKPFQTGYRLGSGEAIAAVVPRSLIQFWHAVQLCVEHDKIIIVQAANTGLNGGSTPFGDGYDRDIVIINTLKIDDILLLNGGTQIVGMAGSTLYQLEDKLKPVGRSPHSVIGSSCIGASIVGGVCNNSGGALVNRGPAYTELSLFAQLNAAGELELVNHLDIDLGQTPEEIFENLEKQNFDLNKVPSTNRLASDTAYQDRVRDVGANTPARFNADKRRLFEASGCAGKIAVFAVRLDTFPVAEREQVFYIGTNQPEKFTELRRRVLRDFRKLPELGEYMHSSYFDGAAQYAKDTYLMIKFLGSDFLPKLFAFKGWIDGYLSKIPFLPDHFADRFLQVAAKLWPNHLPKRMRDYRERFEHHLMINAHDDVIEETRALLDDLFVDDDAGDFFECTESEGDAALLHRFVAGGAPGRFAIIHAKETGGIVPFDIALRRNDEDWHQIPPPHIKEQLAGPFVLSHFFCNVFHHDFVVKKGVDADKLKQEVLADLDARGAKYPAEHNVGHVYQADVDLSDFYKRLDPTNSFNPGIGKTSKLKDHA